jgi:hypothetical protein
MPWLTILVVAMLHWVWYGFSFTQIQPLHSIQFGKDHVKQELMLSMLKTNRINPAQGMCDLCDFPKATMMIQLR